MTGTKDSQVKEPEFFFTDPSLELPPQSADLVIQKQTKKRYEHIVMLCKKEHQKLSAKIDILFKMVHRLKLFLKSSLSETQVRSLLLTSKCIGMLTVVSIFGLCC